MCPIHLTVSSASPTFQKALVERLAKLKMLLMARIASLDRPRVVRHVQRRLFVASSAVCCRDGHISLDDPHAGSSEVLQLFFKGKRWRRVETRAACSRLISDSFVAVGCGSGASRWLGCLVQHFTSKTFSSACLSCVPVDHFASCDFFCAMLLVFMRYRQGCMQAVAEGVVLRRFLVKTGSEIFETSVPVAHLHVWLCYVCNATYCRRHALVRLFCGRARHVHLPAVSSLSVSCRDALDHAEASVFNHDGWSSNRLSQSCPGRVLPKKLQHGDSTAPHREQKLRPRRRF